MLPRHPIHFSKLARILRAAFLPPSPSCCRYPFSLLPSFAPRQSPCFSCCLYFMLRSDCSSYFPACSFLGRSCQLCPGFPARLGFMPSTRLFVSSLNSPGDPELKPPRGRHVTPGPLPPFIPAVPSCALDSGLSQPDRSCPNAIKSLSSLPFLSYLRIFKLVI